jgi:hypothetical protein
MTVTVMTAVPVLIVDPEEETVATEAEGECVALVLDVDVTLEPGEKEDEGVTVSEYDAKAVRVAEGEGLVEFEKCAEIDTIAEDVAELLNEAIVDTDTVAVEKDDFELSNVAADDADAVDDASEENVDVSEATAETESMEFVGNGDVEVVLLSTALID